MKRGRLVLGLGVTALLVSCNRDPEIVQRPVVVYSPASCPVGSDAFSAIYGGGDFDVPLSSTQYLGEVGREMSALPASTRSLLVDVSAGPLSWRGVNEVATDGPTNVLVWRGDQACPLTQRFAARTDMAFSVFGRRFMIVGGSAAGAVPHTYVGDLGTGKIVELPIGLTVPRVRPTVTAFGEGALVAGGSDDSKLPLDSAEVYSPASGEFESARIPLSQKRMLHGAVELGTGETLLVGGSDGAAPLRTMEVIDPVLRRTRTAGVAALAVARTSPTVLRLANGEILVAGGFDANGDAVPTLEWFSRDAAQATKRPVELVTGKERAFVPLDAGGALAIIRPDPPAADFKTVWIISADGTLAPATEIDPQALTTVRLFRGSDGAPIVWTGHRWMRWTPWSGEFRTIDGAPNEGPVLDAIGSGDAGLALWVEERAAEGGSFAVTGFRFAARTPFDSVQNPLISAASFASPAIAQLAPDRLVGEGESAIRVEANGRGLVLDPGASAFVTDVTFADFTLDVEVTASAPVVVVRDDRGAELEVGGASCAFAQSAMHSLAVVRKGRHVTVSADGAPARECPTLLTDGVRVSLGLRGAQSVNVSAARNLVIHRR